MPTNYYPANFRIIAKKIGADMNVTTDQLLTVELGDDLVLPRTGLFTVVDIMVTNASVNLTTAAGGVYLAAGKAGTPIVAAAQVYTALTAPAKFVKLTLAASALTDIYNVDTQPAFYFSLTSAQGVAATADIYVYARTLVN